MTLTAKLRVTPELKSKMIAVLYGGRSEESEISRRTGASILGALKNLNFQAVGIEVDEMLPKRLRAFSIGFCFLALHGRFGEDGTVQGMLEMMQIPYTGSGVLASALCMNKAFTKTVLLSCGIPTAPFRVITPEESTKIKFTFSYPVVVKPVDSGSAIGVTIVYKKSQIEPALKRAWRYSKSALVEPFIVGREITAPVLGKKVLPLIEIIPKASFYDFESKYKLGGSQHIIPAEISSAAREKISKFALMAHKALECRAISRVDFILDRRGNPWVLEINTIPGMTETSLYPESAKFAGISFEELVLEIMKLSL